MGEELRQAIENARRVGSKIQVRNNKGKIEFTCPMCPDRPWHEALLPAKPHGEFIYLALRCDRSPTGCTYILLSLSQWVAFLEREGFDWWLTKGPLGM